MRLSSSPSIRPVTPSAASRAPAPSAAPTAPGTTPAKPASLLSTWKLLAHALLSGQNVAVPGALPPFPTLDPTALAAARQAGQGRTVRQLQLASDPAGTRLHDPVNLELRGSEAEVVQALQSQGWSLAASRSPWNFIRMGLSVLFHLGHDPHGPVSAQYLNGHAEALAFNKNGDYNRGRDHLRIYPLGHDPQTGEPVWGVAAVRDDALSITLPHPDTHGKLWPWQWTWRAPTLSHKSDNNVDGERNLVMQDLLRSGHVRRWAAVDGEPADPTAKRPLGNGRYMLGNRYNTDGQVYVVTLGAKG